MSCEYKKRSLWRSIANFWVYKGYFAGIVSNWMSELFWVLFETSIIIGIIMFILNPVFAYIMVCIAAFGYIELADNIYGFIQDNASDTFRRTLYWFFTVLILIYRHDLRSSYRISFVWGNFVDTLLYRVAEFCRLIEIPWGIEDYVQLKKQNREAKLRLR